MSLKILAGVFCNITRGLFLEMCVFNNTLIQCWRITYTPFLFTQSPTGRLLVFFSSLAYKQQYHEVSATTPSHTLCRHAWGMPYFVYDCSTESLVLKAGGVVVVGGAVGNKNLILWRKHFISFLNFPSHCGTGTVLSISKEQSVGWKLESLCSSISA